MRVNCVCLHAYILVIDLSQQFISSLSSLRSVLYYLSKAKFIAYFRYKKFYFSSVALIDEFMNVSGRIFPTEHQWKHFILFFHRNTHLISLCSCIADINENSLCCMNGKSMSESCKKWEEERRSFISFLTFLLKCWCAESLLFTRKRMTAFRWQIVDAFCLCHIMHV